MLVVWTLRPVHPVCPIVRVHIWLRLVCQETLLNTVFRPDICNQATLPPMHPDSHLITIAHQDLPLP